MFPDDTTIYRARKDTEGVIDILNNAMRELFDWRKKNPLTVHTGKTGAIVIS